MSSSVLNKFLASSKKNFLNVVNGKPNRVVQFIFGNESGDLDSFVSSVVLGWYKTTACHETVSYFIPVMNIDRKDFKLRTETVFLFRSIGIDTGNLLFKDEVNFPSLLSTYKKSFHLTLVDHHVLSDVNSYLMPHVTEIIDHRPVDVQFSDTVDVNIHPVGSCCTLIAEKIVSNKNLCDFPQDVGRCLIGTILLDTYNLSYDSGKTTPRDCAIVDKMKLEMKDLDLKELYMNLKDARTAIDGFDSLDMILKDPKFLGKPPKKVIISTIHQFLFDFLKRPDCKQVITKYCSENGYMSWIGMSPQYDYFPSKPFRPIAVYSSNKQFTDDILSDLVMISDLEVIQEQQDNEILEGFSVFRMYNCKASRKQVLPVVSKCLMKLM